MQEIMLTVREVAELKGCTAQNIQKLALMNKIRCTVILDERNRKTYRIPLSALPNNLQKKYCQQKQTELSSISVEKKVEKSKPLDQYSESERQEIEFWTALISRWQGYRNQPDAANKAEVDQRFVALCTLEYPERRINVTTLYRKWQAIRKGDLDGMIDKRGKSRKGKSRIPPELWNAYLYYYLNESQHPMKRCYEYARLWAQQLHPELVADMPAYETFYRHTYSDIPEPLRVLSREGEKAYDDKCGAYIRRIYDDLESNEFWIADNHTFDVIVVDAEGKRYRPYLTAFLDARSGIFVGWYVTHAPSSNATLVALRRGILKYGIPKNVYVDNGREFLTYDIGGLGHRKKKLKSGEEPFEPPGVFQRLGINMTNAIVRNAKAKVIERRFLDVKNQFSRIFDTFVGGNVLEKPERLKKVLKKGEIITDEEFSELVDLIIEHYLNHQEYNGPVVKDKGKKRIDVYNQYLETQRKAPPEELTLMLMRTSRPVTIGRNGVSIKIGGALMDYYDDDLKNTLFGHQVYARYDPDDLSEVRIYDLDDRYIRTVPSASQAVQKYGASEDEIKEAMRITRSPKRHAKELLDGLLSAGADQRSVIDLLITKANENKEEYADIRPNPKVIDIVRVNETPLLQRVSGDEVDISVMTRNALKKRGGNQDE